MTRPRLPRTLRDYHGLPPQQRAELIADAKKITLRFRWAVARRNAGEIQRLLGPRIAARDCEFLAALAVVLADGAAPFQLRAVTEAADDGLPERGAA